MRLDLELCFLSSKNSSPTADEERERERERERGDWEDEWCLASRHGLIPSCHHSFPLSVLPSFLPSFLLPSFPYIPYKVDVDRLSRRKIIPLCGQLSRGEEGGRELIAAFREEEGTKITFPLPAQLRGWFRHAAF